MSSVDVPACRPSFLHGAWARGAPSHAHPCAAAPAPRRPGQGCSCRLTRERQHNGDRFTYRSRVGASTRQRPTALPSCAPQVRLAELAASASEDCTVRVWRLADRACVRTLQHASGVLALADLGCGRLASGDAIGTLRVWDVDSGTELLSRSTGDCIYSIAALPGARLATGHAGGAVRVWRIGAAALHTLRPLELVGGHTGDVYAMAVVRAGGVLHLVWGSVDGAIRLWNVDAGDPALVRTLGGHAGIVLSLAALGGGLLLSAGCGAGPLRLWNLASGQRYVLQGSPGVDVNVVVPLPDGRVVTADFDNVLQLWRMTSTALGRALQADGAPFEYHHEAVVCAAYAGGGRLLTGCREGTVRLWDVDCRHSEALLEEHTQEISGVVAVRGPQTRASVPPLPARSLVPPTGAAWRGAAAARVEAQHGGRHRGGDWSRGRGTRHASSRASAPRNSAPRLYRCRQHLFRRTSSRASAPHYRAPPYYRYYRAPPYYRYYRCRRQRCCRRSCGCKRSSLRDQPQPGSSPDRDNSRVVGSASSIHGHGDVRYGTVPASPNAAASHGLARL